MGLVRAAQRDSVNEPVVRKVLTSLAIIAGPAFPSLALFDTEEDVEFDAQKLLVRVAETWKDFLTGIATGHVLQLKMTESFRGLSRLKALADFTIGLHDRCQETKAQKEVARYVCTSLGALGWLVKDELQVVKKIADWLSECIECFMGYPEVAHEGLGALVELCKQRREIFGVSVAEESQLDMSQLGEAEQAEAENETEEGGREEMSSFSSISAHLKDKAMGFAYTFEARSDINDDTAQKAFKLVAHTHPLLEVVRVIVTSKNRNSSEMLWSVLNEINDSLHRVINVYGGKGCRSMSATLTTKVAKDSLGLAVMVTWRSNGLPTCSMRYA